MRSLVRISVIALSALGLNGCAAQSGPVAASATSAEHRAGTVRANGIDIAYQVDGPADGMPLVFIVGLAGQMSEGRDSLTQALIDQGFRVVRFDNRDSGRTTHMTQAGPPPSIEEIVTAIQAGRAPPVAYSIMDMAEDTAALMTALGIERAHILGGSMGGMIAQVFASRFPERTMSLISVSSTSGNPQIAYGPALAQLMESTSPARNDEERLDRKVVLFQALEGTRYRQNPAQLRASLRAELDRSDDQVATARQSTAIIPYADRREMLRGIRVPALVLHGSDDPLFPLPHARDQVENLPNARLEVIEGMGHLLPDEVSARFAQLVAEHARRAR